MVAKDPNLLLQFGVVCDHRPGLAKRTEVLSGIETKATRVADGARPAPLVFGPVGLRSIFDNEEVMRARNLKDRDPYPPAGRKDGRA